MSNDNSGSTFASSMASDVSLERNLPIVSLLEDVDAYGVDVFDMSAKTLLDLQRVQQNRSHRGDYVDWRRLTEDEITLTNFLRRIEDVRKDLTDIRAADFNALSLIWNNVAYLVGQDLRKIIANFANIEQKVGEKRAEVLDGEGHISPIRAHAVTAEELLRRHRSLMDTDDIYPAVRYRRDVFPCRGALRLMGGNDTGDIDRCLKKHLTVTELQRLSSGGDRGVFLFWKCDSCAFRVKYFVSKSRAATLLSNNDRVIFAAADSVIRCSRAFLAMSHLEQRESNSSSTPTNHARYTCVICALHRPAATPGRNHTFPRREDYGKHVQLNHMGTYQPPAFVQAKLGIDCSKNPSEGTQRVLWTSSSSSTEL